MKYFLMIMFGFACAINSDAQTSPALNDQSFGKGAVTLYVGSGALKRHLDINRLNYKPEEFSKSPALVLGADFCIYPHASNAYLGLGPYATSWIGVKETVDNNRKTERLFSNTTLAVKFTHHASYFVRKKLDVCSGYLVGVNLKYYHSYKIDGRETATSLRKSELVPAFGIVATIRYYALNNAGLYIEGGIGYRINMLNVGLCYKLKRKG